MASGTNKLKVVWICHFLNQSVKQKLGIDKGEREYTPWVSLGIDEAKKRDDLELHVIAPLYRIRRNKSYSEDNVHYHFIRAGIPFTKTAWPPFFKLDRWSNYRRFNRQVKREVQTINPQAIDLLGAENAYYSSSILKIQRIPVIVTIQGFIITSSLENKSEPDTKYRIRVEDAIMRRFNNYGLAGNEGPKDLIKSYNPNARFFKYQNAYAKTTLENRDVPKEYDLVFFATLNERKGIEDLIKAVSEVKKKGKDVTLCIIGNGTESYKQKLRDLIDELGITANIVFKGFLQPQQRLHEEVVKAKVSVLPTYQDRMPGTIVESMLLGLPVISTAVGGIPYLNEGEERIVLIQEGKVDLLADEIYKLLEDPGRQKKLSDKAREYALVEFDNAINLERQIHAYKQIIQDYPASL